MLVLEVSGVKAPYCLLLLFSISCFVLLLFFFLFLFFSCLLTVMKLLLGRIACVIYAATSAETTNQRPTDPKNAIT